MWTKTCHTPIVTTIYFSKATSFDTVDHPIGQLNPE